MNDTEENLFLRVLYPQPDLFLIPQKILPLVVGRAIFDLDGNSLCVESFSSLKISDLSLSNRIFISDQIADLVQSVIYSRKSIPKLMEITLDVPSSIRLSDLALSQRARVSLQSRPFFNSEGRWRSCNLHELTSTHAMGARLLLALLLGIEAADAKKENTKDKLVAGNDVPIFPRANDLKCDLKSEITEILPAPRSADIFLSIFGWDGKGKKSLAQVGKKHGVSKERTRQILYLAENVTSKGLLKRLAPKQLLSAIALLDRLAPLGVCEASRQIMVEKISNEPFHPDGIISAAGFWGIENDLCIISSGETEILIRTCDVPLLHGLQSRARSIIRRLGILKESWLANEFEKCEQKVSLHLVRSALRLDETLSKLSLPEERGSWFCANKMTKPTGLIARVFKKVSFFGYFEIHNLFLEFSSNRVVSELNIPSPIPCDVIEAAVKSYGFEEFKSGFWSSRNEDLLSICHASLPNDEREIGLAISDNLGPIQKSVLQEKLKYSSIKSNTLARHVKNSTLIAPSLRGDSNLSLSSSFEKFQFQPLP